MIKSLILKSKKKIKVMNKIVKLTRVHQPKKPNNIILFEGPPGTGKTTAAKILAKQMGSTFFYVQSEKVLSKFYG